MPILVKGDDVRSGRKARGLSRPVTAGTGVNGLKNEAVVISIEMHLYLTCVDY